MSSMFSRLSAPVLGLLAAACAMAEPPSPGALRPAARQQAAQQSEEAGELDRGRFLVRTHCLSCHAERPNQRSRHPEAPSLARLSEEYPVSALEEAFAEGILVGHPDMPEFRLAPADIRAVLAYLQSIQLKQGA